MPRAREGSPMIDLRRGTERQHVRRGKLEVWHTFSRGADAGAPGDGFRGLAALDEIRLAPGADLTPPPRRHEMVTYVREGALAHEDSTGRSGVVQAGEFQRLTVVRGVRGRQRNASSVDGAHLFQLGLGPLRPGLSPRHEQKRFTTAQRRNGWCLVASPDRRDGSLGLDQDARIYSALLAPGQHLVHEIGAARGAWLHVIEGEATLDGLLLTSGDAAGFTAERALSVTAREKTEVLLVDLGEQPPADRARGGS